MLLVAPVSPSKRLPPPEGGEGAPGLDRLRVPRSVIPAVTHVDGSTRVQTVDPGRHGLYRRLLERFRRETGCPVLVNTSFNVREEPIVRSPEDAYRCFLATEMDALAIGSCLLLREGQPPLDRTEREAYLRVCEEGEGGR
jgi:carbamoyltransferase